MQIVLASQNAGKLEELRALIACHAPHLKVRAYTGELPVETGLSFAQNALLKARAAHRATGLPALADDSGLTVDVLGGSPGIFSARWSRDFTPVATACPAAPEEQPRNGDTSAPKISRDEANYRLLLAQIADIPEAARTASFVCAAAIAWPGGEHFEHGTWPGSILPAPRGTAGFGYDPVFLPRGSRVSAAEMSLSEKNRVSHRTRAFTALLKTVSAKL